LEARDDSELLRGCSWICEWVDKRDFWTDLRAQAGALQPGSYSLMAKRKRDTDEQIRTDTA
jgi:hypothetical protein